MRGDRLFYSELLRLSDDSLMQEVCAGNDDAFAVVFKRYHHLVQTVALRILRDAAEAEDMTQAVFLEIFRNAAQFDCQRGSLKVLASSIRLHPEYEPAQLSPDPSCL